MKKTKQFTFFWKTDDVFSNWHPAKFIDHRDGVIYNCSEQFMMKYKALIFDDTETAAQIMQAQDPKEQKRLGRLVKNFNMDIWKLHAKRIVSEGCYLKFHQNFTMFEELMNTRGTMLTEASPTDLLWGIGMKEDDIGVEDIKNWKGQNWLGDVLTSLRGILEIEAAHHLSSKDNFSEELDY